MEKISGILAPTSRPVWQSSEIPRPKRISDPQPDDKDRMEAIRPPKIDFSEFSFDEMKEGDQPIFSRGSMLDIKA